MSWAADYDLQQGLANRTLKAHLDWLAEQQCPVLKIVGEVSTADRIRLVLERLEEMEK